MTLGFIGKWFSACSYRRQTVEGAVFYAISPLGPHALASVATVFRQSLTRTVAICLCLVLLLGRSLDAVEPGPEDAWTSPHAQIQQVGLNDVRWTTGFWADKAKLCREAILPAVQAGLQNPANSEQLSDLRVAAGMQQGTHQGTNWGDGDCYKWLETMAWVYAETKDPELDRMLDEWIEVIARAQREDGYISTNIEPPKTPLEMPYYHEMYNMGHLLTAACVHHRATGKDSFLRLARKTGDYLDKRFRPEPADLVHFPWNPSVYMGLVDLYRTTGEKRYLELAEILVGNRGSSPGGDHRNGGTDQTQDRVPIRQETRAVGHAVCATYLYCGAADLAAETGDVELIEALDRVWRNVTSRQMYVTGAVGPGSGISPRGDPVHEAFLADYQLPNREAYAETCSNIGLGMWNYRMLRLTGNAKYADVMEKVLYNSMLAAVHVDGKGFFYCNPLRWTGEEHGPGRHHESERWAVYDCYCCPPQVSRTLAKLHGWAYGVSDDAVWVHLFGGSRLETRLPDGSPVALSQKTDYPWDGRVEIRVDDCPDRPFSLTARIPGWAEGATVRVNGEPWTEPIVPGAYVDLRRTWRSGDLVEIDLPMPARLIEANPLVEGNRNQVAVARGPVVYCLELPLDAGGEETWRQGVFLPENIVLTPRHAKNLLGSVTVLEGDALTFQGRDAFASHAPLPEPPEWEDTLYRPLQPRNLKQPGRGTVPVTLIPYFAWANRGRSYMEVWIPLARPAQRTALDDE